MNKTEWKAMTEEQRDDYIDSVMEQLDCSWKEAESVVLSDMEIDSMKDSEVLSKDERKLIQSLTSTKGENKPKEKKARKPKELNAEKVDILDTIVSALIEQYPDTVRRSDAEINFGEGKYTLKLVLHRQKKE